jgi:uroporphyrinogen-III synthase
VPVGLRGQVILNTRPVHQLAGLSASLEHNGAQVLSFPVIDIVLSDDSALRNRLALEIAQYDILLFVSRNAVDGAFAYIDAPQLNPAAAFGVIGEATHRALAAKVTHLDSCLVAGEPYNSEALLEADLLQQVAGRRVLIFRGQQGRNLLGDELVARGAMVDYCEVYRRELPRFGSDAFNGLVADAFPDIVILTSNEGMHNLFELVDAQSAERLCRIPWLLISERMRESAGKLGHNASIIIAHNASDNGILQTICDWADRR